MYVYEMSESVKVISIENFDSLVKEKGCESHMIHLFNIEGKIEMSFISD